MNHNTSSFLGSSSLDVYLREINRVPLLTVAQEKKYTALWIEKENEQVFQLLVRSNLRFVVKIAYEYKRYGLRLLDLIQEGNLGLIMAIKKYDPDKGVRLISYAVWWIRAQIQNYILQNWRIVKIGTTQAQRKLFYNLEKTKRELAKLQGTNDVSRHQIALALNVDEKIVEEMEQRLGSNELSLDYTFQSDSDESSRSLMDILPDVVNPSQEELLCNAEWEELRKRHLCHALLRLSERERVIVQRRRLNMNTETLSEIGKDLGITRERVRQLEARSITKLQMYLAEGGFEKMELKEKVEVFA